MFVGRQKRCQFHGRDYITDNVSLGQNWQVKMLNYAQNSSRFKDGSNSMISVVYHLPQIPGNPGWDVNDKRFFGFVPLENSRDRRKFWKGGPGVLTIWQKKPVGVSKA